MSNTLTLAATGITLLGEFLGIASLIISIRWPENRIWPPGEVSWKF